MTKILSSLGILLLSVAFFSWGYHIVFIPERLTEIGTFDFILRTGGTLHRPNTSDIDYRLTHTVYDPGNTTLQTVPEFELFGIYYQIILAISYLDNGSYNTDPKALPPGTRYEMTLDLNTTIEIESGQDSSILLERVNGETSYNIQVNRYRVPSR